MVHDLLLLQKDEPSGSMEERIKVEMLEEEVEKGLNKDKEGGLIQNREKMEMEIEMVKNIRPSIQEKGDQDQVQSQGSPLNNQAPGPSHAMQIHDQERSASSFKDKVHRLTFVKKKNPSSSIQIPAANLKKIKKGKTWVCYNSSSYSFLTIRMVRPRSAPMHGVTTAKESVDVVTNSQNSNTVEGPLNCGSRDSMASCSSLDLMSREDDEVVSTAMPHVVQTLVKYDFVSPRSVIKKTLVNHKLAREVRRRALRIARTQQRNANPTSSLRPYRCPCSKKLNVNSCYPINNLKLHLGDKRKMINDVLQFSDRRPKERKKFVLRVANHASPSCSKSYCFAFESSFNFESVVNVCDQPTSELPSLVLLNSG